MNSYHLFKLPSKNQNLNSEFETNSNGILMKTWKAFQ